MDDDGESIPREEERQEQQQQDIAAMFLLDIVIQCQRNDRPEMLLELMQVRKLSTGWLHHRITSFYS